MPYLEQIRPSPVPGFFIAGTDTGVGKTMIAAAIARTLYLQGRNVAVLKPAATGCEHRREGLVSTDAELLAVGSETRQPLDLICPNRYLEPLAPSVAARRARQPLDWSAVQRSIDLMTRDANTLIVEGVGGVLVPMDDSHTLLDLIVALRLPTVVVARASLGTINHTLLTLEALRRVKAPIAGVVINRYPTDLADAAEETAAAEIERFGRVPVLALAPDEPFTPPTIPPGVLSAIGFVDWESRLLGTH
ncbi:MAG: dethiobiotin synthase [Tepidisphaeraceae bacterium]